MKRSQEFVLYLLVALSGAAALIYEVAWHRYLGILLGSQAEATAVTLSVFLGSLAMGYTVLGRVSTKLRSPVTAYALVELGIGVWALLFPLVFSAARELSLALYSWFGIQSLLTDFVLSILLVAPPSFLMGGTLPLLTAYIATALPGEEVRRAHARIYGVNTIGACLGVLLAGYVLIDTLGLKASVYAAGATNLLIGAAAFALLDKKKSAPDVSEVKSTLPWKHPICWVAFLSGFWALTLQSVLVRLVGLSVGSSPYTFTLVLALSVLLLGIGGLSVGFVKRHSASSLFTTLCASAVSLYLLYWSVGYWPYLGHFTRIIFRSDSTAFWPYQISVFGLYFGIFAIPLALGGTILPLCFAVGARAGNSTAGADVGRIYGANALGCVMGALVGGYLLLHVWNLDVLFKICILAAGTGAAAVGLYAKAGARIRKATPIALVLFTVSVLATPGFRNARFISPYRQQNPIPGVTSSGPQAFEDHVSKDLQLTDVKDGPNTSVMLGASHHQGQESSLTLFVNGKSDGNTSADFVTSSLLAHLPGLLAEKVTRAAIVGFGTGITLGTLARYEEVESIDLIEISGTVLDVAPRFDRYNFNASKSPKVHNQQMDAFRYLAASRGSLDLLISAPSNPWVSGVENLFTTDFYQIAAERLGPRGTFVQWVQTYAFDPPLFAMVLKSLRSVFPYVYAFRLQPGDIGFFASFQPIDLNRIKLGRVRLEQNVSARLQLEEHGIREIETLLALEAFPHTVASALTEGALVHTLERPRLARGASRTFFTQTDVDVLRMARSRPEYRDSLPHSLLALATQDSPLDETSLSSLEIIFCEPGLSQDPVLCGQATAALLATGGSVRERAKSPVSDTERDGLRAFAAPLPERFEPGDIETVRKMVSAYRKHISPLVRLDLDRLWARLAVCLRSSARTSALYGECLTLRVDALHALEPGSESFRSAERAYAAWRAANQG